METMTLSDSASSDTEFYTPETWTPRPRFRVEIRRQRYVPGTGPALQPPRLLPLVASTGHITERILLPSPGLAADGRPLPKRMTYIVGWRDLPAASLQVPAMDILQYVSPRVLEEWEDRLELEMDEERRRSSDDAEGADRDTSRRARRRPPAHTAIEQPAAVEQEEPDGWSPVKGQGMSLSTPKKRKLSEFEGLSDEEDGPTKQLARELSEKKNGVDMTNAGGVAVSDLGHGNIVIAAANGGLKRDEYIDMTGLKRPVTQTPVPLPPLITCKPGGGSGPAPARPRPTIVRLGMDGSSTPPTRNASVVLSIEGGTLARDGGSAAAAGIKNEAPSSSFRDSSARKNRRKTTSAGGTPSASAHRPRRRSESFQRRTRKKQRTRQVPESTDATVAENMDDAAWEVERILDMALYDVENRGLVRYFLVRWVGDWPPEQNPSWEPEDNLPAELVRAYLKLDKGRRARLAASHQRSAPASGGGAGAGAEPAGRVARRRYASVREAFEGGLDEHPGGNDLANGERDSEDHSLDSNVFVVAEGLTSEGNHLTETPVPLPPTAFGVLQTGGWMDGSDAVAGARARGRGRQRDGGHGHGAVGPFL